MEPTIHGQCHAQFEPVREAFASNFTDGADLGASVAVTVEGEYVVDLWGGHLDEDRKREWQQDTIVNVYSTTKTMAAISALVLADRGEIDLYAPVARYWPEFAQNGKADVEVRHFMSHSAGLSGMDGPLVAADAYDWEKMTTLLARQAPWWKPGTQSGYHAHHAGISDRRSRSARDRTDVRHIFSAARSRSRWAPTFTSASIRGTSTASAT